MEEDDKTLTKRERKRLNREKKREEESKKSQQEGMTKKLLFAGLVIIGAFFIWNMLQGGGSSDTDSTTPDFSSASGIRPTDHVKGNPNANLVLVEYGDFQCPACADYYPTVKEISQIYQDDIAVVFRHFPLPSHRNAKISSYAAEAASRQGAFWQMHDLLFERQETWEGVRDPRSDFVGYAEEIGLDIEKFEQDLDSNELREFVDSSYNEGIVLGVNSTPTFLINGENVRIAPTVAAFQVVIDEALSQLPQENDSTDSAELQDPESEETTE